MRKVVLIFVFVACVPAFTFAQGAVGYDFLRTDVGARAASMAGAFIAVRGDIHSISYNPAGLSSLTDRQGTITYLNHLLDFQSGFLGYVQPIRRGTGAIAVNYYDFGTLEGFDEFGVETGDFGASGLVLSTGYSEELFDNFSLGASAKYIRFQIDNYTASAIAADIGAMFSLPEHDLTFGLGAFNVGVTTDAFIETKDDLPLNFQFGFSKQLEHLPVMLSAALVKFKEETLDFRLGGEATLSENFFLRLGYNSVGQDQKVDTGKDKFAGASFGFGLKFDKFEFDYSLSSFGEVGLPYRVSLIGRL